MCHRKCDIPKEDDGCQRMSRVSYLCRHTRQSRDPVIRSRYHRDSGGDGLGRTREGRGHPDCCTSGLGWSIPTITPPTITIKNACAHHRQRRPYNQVRHTGAASSVLFVGTPFFSPLILSRVISNAVIRSKGDKTTYYGHEFERCRDYSSLHYRLPFEKVRKYSAV